MKKFAAFICILVCALGFMSCGKNDTYRITFTIPAGSTGTFVYSNEEISATGKKITIASNQQLGDASVILAPVRETVTAGYVATYITPGMPAAFDAEKGEWFKIGLSARNESNAAKTAYVEVTGVETRIE